MMVYHKELVILFIVKLLMLKKYYFFIVTNILMEALDTLHLKEKVLKEV
jgi:hypothetical protein